MTHSNSNKINRGKSFIINTIVVAVVVTVISSNLTKKLVAFLLEQTFNFILHFLVLLVFQDGDLEELPDVWLTNVNSERSKCFKDQANANHEMIRRFSKRHKIAEYKIREIVYVFNNESKSRKGEKILGKIPAFDGRVIEEKGGEYKIQCETDKSKFRID